MKVSDKQKLYLRRNKFLSISIKLCQFGLGLLLLIIWEALVHFNIIDSFIFSSPSLIIKTIISLFKYNLLKHIGITFFETIISFIITSIISLILAIILYENNFIYKILDPYLTMLNSLPKVALGPIIIIWCGANIKSIIMMAILISIIISIQNIYTGFINTDKNKIKLIKTFGGNKVNILFNLVIPSNINNILSTLKINISMCLVGVIMGEFLTSKAGIGYLILYGSQTFNLNIVMSGIIVLIIISIIIYIIITSIEKHLVNN